VFHATNCRTVRHCRPDCCKPRGQAPGITAAALVVIGAGIVVHKIGHTLATIAHIAIDVILLAVLTAGVISAVALVTWVAVWLVRWWLGHREARRDQVDQVTRNWMLYLRPVRNEPACPACGGNRQVLRSDGCGGFEPRACPECNPVRLAR
jgi:hypothetical protein